MYCVIFPVCLGFNTLITHTFPKLKLSWLTLVNFAVLLLEEGRFKLLLIKHQRL